MSRENYDNYDQEDFTYHAADHSASDAINSETMEKKDPAVNQHQDESQRHNYSEDHLESDNEDTENRPSDENDTSDPFFQKNAPIAQDLHEDLKNEVGGNDEDEDENDAFDNDANRRTLDEEKAVEDDDDEY